LTFLDKEADMRNQISVTVIINRPPSDVFASLIDLSKWPQWGGGNLVSMEQFSAGRLQVGSQLRQVTRTGRKLSKALVQVTHFVPNQTLGIERPNLRGAFTVEPVETGTRLNARLEVEAAGITALMYRLFLGQFVKNDLQRFKAMVEAS
jgi:uncharacterized protein YndB with AHSA1/START domain